jgi:glycosyltransferase involved in cell wall biosynthesis
MVEKTPLRLLIIADGRSPITRRWMAMLKPLGYHLCLVSSSPCEAPPEVDSFFILPLAFSQLGGSQAGGGTGRGRRSLVKYLRPLAQKARHWLGPWTIAYKQEALRNIIAAEKPDILHAMRIPYEGMLAGFSAPAIPLVISTWGNDLTLHAPATPRMRALTRRALSHADALISDTHIDVARAANWGFDSQKPSLVVPGNGGIDVAEVQQACQGVVKGRPFRVLNPRGLRSYVHTDTFFKAIPLVLKELPEVQFTCTSMWRQPEAEKWVSVLGIEKNVTLLPLLSQQQVWQEFARSQVSVSVSSHDGTPNTLLEAMALGSFPICGDLPSIREWITDGGNGLLVDPKDPQALADALLRALTDGALREKAAKLNSEIIRAQADLESTRQKVAHFFAQLKDQKPRSR